MMMSNLTSGSDATTSSLLPPHMYGNVNSHNSHGFNSAMPMMQNLHPSTTGAASVSGGAGLNANGVNSVSGVGVNVLGMNPSLGNVTGNQNINNINNNNNNTLNISTSNAILPMLRSTESFKVLTECPLIVMLLFQLYPRYIHRNIPNLLPSMMNVLNSHIPLNIANLHKTRFKEFIAAQVCKKL